MKSFSHTFDIPFQRTGMSLLLILLEVPPKTISRKGELKGQNTRPPGEKQRKETS